VRVDQSFKELRELVKGRSGMEIDRDFLHLINTRPYWAPLALAECATEVDAGADAERRTVGRPGRLALESACGARVHLLTDARAQIGRSRDCEILARVLDDAGRQLDEPSRRISRYHACLEWEAESCRIVDRGYHADAKVWKPSASGTWVDGRRLAAGGEFRFAPGREYQVALGDPAAAGGPVFQFAARLWLARDVPNVRPGCPDLRGAPDAPACLALRRVGGPPEHYLLVRRAASLAWVDARCGAACVCARLDGLHFSDGHGCDPLIPGRTVRAGSLDLRVTAAKPPAPAGI
jgi:pSer/pThr/pTyr-binding forkhead associated (FHA) protein